MWCTVFNQCCKTAHTVGVVLILKNVSPKACESCRRWWRLTGEQKGREALVRSRTHAGAAIGRGVYGFRSRQSQAWRPTYPRDDQQRVKRGQSPSNHVSIAAATGSLTPPMTHLQVPLPMYMASPARSRPRTRFEARLHRQVA